MRRSGFGVVGLAMLVVAPNVTRGDYTVSFTEIAETGTPVPGTVGTFTSFGLPSGDREDGAQGVEDFYFEAQSSNGNSGIYHFNSEFIPPNSTLSSIGVIADTTMPAPTGGLYSGFSNTSSGNTEYGFIANTTIGKQLVMEGDLNTFLTVIAATGSSPAAGKTFGSFQSISFMAEESLFTGYTPTGEINSDIGIYDFSYPYPQYSGDPNAVLKFTPVASTSIIPPGASSPFSSFGPVSYKAGLTASINPGKEGAIRAEHVTVGSVEGIYYGEAGPLADTPAPLIKLADTNTPVPFSTGSFFTSFGNPVVNSNEIAFTATYNTTGQHQQGVFAFGPFEEYGFGPSLYQLASTGEVAPDANGAHFASFSAIVAIPYEEFFLATLDNGVTGLYFSYDSLTSLSRALDTTETLDGKSIANIEMSSEAGNGESDTNYAATAFKVDFTDGSEGLYYFTVTAPEPAFLALPLGLAWLFGRRRNCRR